SAQNYLFITVVYFANLPGRYNQHNSHSLFAIKAGSNGTRFLPPLSPIGRTPHILHAADRIRMMNAPQTLQPHDHRHCIDDALSRAETVCAERGARMTPLRRRVLELVWDSHAPIGAYAIMDLLRAADDRAAAPPTVYRALEFLLDQGLVHKIESLNAFVG